MVLSSKEKRVDGQEVAGIPWQFCGGDARRPLPSTASFEGSTCSTLQVSQHPEPVSGNFSSPGYPTLPRTR